MNQSTKSYSTFNPLERAVLNSTDKLLDFAGFLGKCYSIAEENPIIKRAFGFSLNIIKSVYQIAKGFRETRAKLKHNHDFQASRH